MPYKDKALQQEKTLERVRRYRDKQKGVTKEGVTEQGVTQYPAIAEALIDPVKRVKLEKVCTELKGRGLLKEVRYGVNGPTFDVVGELLEVTH